MCIPKAIINNAGESLSHREVNKGLGMLKTKCLWALLTAPSNCGIGVGESTSNNFHNFRKQTIDMLTMYVEE